MPRKPIWISEDAHGALSELRGKNQSYADMVDTLLERPEHAELDLEALQLTPLEMRLVVQLIRTCRRGNDTQVLVSRNESVSVMVKLEGILEQEAVRLRLEKEERARQPWRGVA